MTNMYVLTYVVPVQVVIVVEVITTGITGEVLGVMSTSAVHVESTIWDEAPSAFLTMVHVLFMVQYLLSHN